MPSPLRMLGVIVGASLAVYDLTVIHALLFLDPEAIKWRVGDYKVSASVHGVALLLINMIVVGIMVGYRNARSSPPSN